MPKQRSVQDNNDMSDLDQKPKRPRARSKRARSLTTSPATR